MEPIIITKKDTLIIGVSAQFIILIGTVEATLGSEIPQRFLVQTKFLSMSHAIMFLMLHTTTQPTEFAHIQISHQVRNTKKHSKEASQVWQLDQL